MKTKGVKKMCKKAKNPALAVALAVLALSVASPAFAGGIALTGTIPPAPAATASAGRGIPLTGTQGTALNGTTAITGITGQALTGTRPARTFRSLF